MQYCLTVDTEEEWDWSAGFPVGDWGTGNILRLDRFADMCQKHCAKTTYLVNHAVLDNDSSNDVIVSLDQSEDVEIGMHLHPWTTPPLNKQDNRTRTSFLENIDTEFATEKLQQTYDLHRQRGFNPTSFRGGRYSSGAITQSFLRENRFRVDSSLCPFSMWPDDGAPNYSRDGLTPSQIHSSNNEQPALWSVPLTRMFSRRPFSFWNTVCNSIEHTPLRKLRLIGLMERAGLVRRIWLNFETESTDAMLWTVRHAHALNLPYLCFTVHSSSLSVGPSPYAQNQDQVDRIFEGIERVLSLLASDSRFEPATLNDIANQLDRLEQTPSVNTSPTQEVIS